MATMQDEEDWLTQQAEAGRADIAATPVQGPGQAQSGQWAKVQELLSRQQGMQYQAPEQYTKPIVAEAAPKSEDWKTILGMAMNMLGDKGRGLGQVMQAGTDARNRQLRDWRQSNSPAALQQREMQQIQMRNADRQGFEHDRAALGQQAQQLMAVAGAEDATMRDERNFGRQQERDIAGDVQHQLDKEQQAEQFTASQGLTREQMRQQAASAAASRAQADRHFRLQQEQHQLDQDNQLNRDRDNYAHSDSARREGYAHEDAQLTQKNQLQKDLHDLTHPMPVTPEGWSVKPGQEAQFRQAMANKGVESKLLGEIGNAAQIQNTIGQLIELRSAPSSAANKKLYDAALKSLIGDRSQEGSTGVLSGTEFERYLSDLPEYGSIGNVSTMRGAYDVFRGKDPALETLTGFKKQFKNSMAAKATPYGIQWAEDMPAAPMPQQPQTAAVGAPPAPAVEDFTGIPGLTKRKAR